MSQTELTVKPVLKWVGGKSKLLPRLLSHVPAELVSGASTGVVSRTVAAPPGRILRATYIEPFAGSAALLFALQPQRAILSDLNPHLIHFYKTVRDHPADCLALLKAMQQLCL